MASHDLTPITDRLDKIEGKLDTLIEQQAKINTTLYGVEGEDGLAKRFDHMEGKIYMMGGIGASVGAIVGFIGSRIFGVK